MAPTNEASHSLPLAPEFLRDADETISLDWTRLQAHLASKDLALDLSQPPRQFRGGYGNLNFLVRLDDGWAVLRRPPFGDLPKGANDMGREHRVLSVLAPVWELAPRSLCYEAEADVLGAPFLISEFRSGLPLHGTTPLGDRMTEAKSRHLSLLQIDIIRQLHGFDIATIGAERLGRAEGFAARTLAGWSARRDGAVVPAPPVGDTLFRMLQAMEPADQRRSVIHNDFKLDNVVVDPETLTAKAVLDWDMSTLGSPFFDLATLLSYWIGPDDPDELRGINLTHSLALGALSRRELVEAYFSATGFDGASDEADLRFFLGLAFAKLGVVCQQLYGRFVTNPSTNQRNEMFGAAIPGAFELGIAAIEGSLF